MHKKTFGSGTRLLDLAKQMTLVISNELMSDIMTVVKSLEERNLLIKSVRKTIKNEAKEQKGEFLSVLLRTSVSSLSGNLLTGKGTIRAAENTIRVDESTIGAVEDL